MKYTKQQAKEYAREHFRGVWAATATPFTTDLKLDDATIVTALLHDVIEDTPITRAEIDQLFGTVRGVLGDAPSQN